MDSPVTAQNRLVYLDILRGFAVMAIFIVNIKAMAMPFGYYSNPTLWPGEHDQFIATILNFLVDNKWRTIFTALFGAGLVLIGEKIESKGARGRMGLRLFWLLIFGLCHMLLIWMGDILTLYALSGFLALWFARMPLPKLRKWAIGIMCLALLWVSLMNLAPAFSPELAEEIEPMMWGTDAAYNQKEIATALGSVHEQIMTRMNDAVGFILFYMLLGGFLIFTTAIMLWGMVLYRMGFLQGTARNGTYFATMLIAFAVSFGIEAIRLDYNTTQDWNFIAFSLTSPLALISGLAGALGWSSLIALLVKSKLWLRPFADAGRMAFTNYIACSLIGTTLYGPYMTAKFGQVSLQELILVVFAVWAAILVWSPLWLSYFRFGPLEWLWRSFTYMKIQPFKRLKA
ncbi:MAG: DUF418 domain-containing protein [bacterium]